MKIYKRFASIIMLVVTLGLLVATMYSWYATNRVANVYNMSASTSDEVDDVMITFNTGDDHVDVPVVPGSFSSLKISISSEKKTYATVKFMTPVITWKDITTEYTALSSKTTFEPGIYYNSEHELLMEEPDDFEDEYASYFTVSDTVVTSLVDGTTYNTDFLSVYGVNEYYEKQEDDSYKKLVLTEGQKRTEFLKLYQSNQINMYESLYVYVSTEQVLAKDYTDTLMPKYLDGDFKNIFDSEINFDAVNEDGQTMYLYFYYDPTDLYFSTSENIYFRGQNPYFLQSNALNLFIV